jgi:hypothetical protein
MESLKEGVRRIEAATKDKKGFGQFFEGMAPKGAVL